MAGYYWAILFVALVEAIGVGLLIWILYKMSKSLEAVRSLVRVLLVTMSDNDRNEMSRHAETIVYIERLEESMKNKDTAEVSEEELTEEEKEIRRKQEQMFTDGVSNILNYGV